MRIHVHPRVRLVALQLGIAASVGIWFGGSGVLACKGPQTAPPPPLPESPWGEKYAYSYDLPAGSARAEAGSIPVTIAVVNPSYREAESALGTDLYLKVGKGFSTSMGVDLDKILLAKGTTTLGPFPSLDELTYSDKKGAALTLAPKVFISVEVKNTDKTTHVRGSNREEQHFAMSVTGWISFILEEPMTGEKMWIKKLELDPVTMEGLVAWESLPVFTDDGCGGTRVSGYQSGKMIYDGRRDAMASALKQIYPIVLSQFQKYLDPEEMVQLKEKGKEIRNLKVYSGN